LKTYPKLCWFFGFSSIDVNSVRQPSSTVVRWWLSVRLGLQHVDGQYVADVYGRRFYRLLL